MASTTTSYETSTWDTYGKWSLVAIVLLLFVVALFAIVYSWEQGYFDTVKAAPSRAASALSGASSQIQSLNFSSYKSTINARLRGLSTLPEYSPNRLQQGMQGTPEPSYRTHASPQESEAHEYCPLPVSPNPYAGAIDLTPPEPAVTRSWRTVDSTCESLRPILNDSSTLSTSRKSKKSSITSSTPRRTPNFPSQVPSPIADRSTISALSGQYIQGKQQTPLQRLDRTSPAMESTRTSRTAASSSSRRSGRSSRSNL